MRPEVVKALKTLTPGDMMALQPKRDISSITYEEDKKVKQEGFNIKFDVDDQIWNDEMKPYKRDMAAAYSKLIDEYCNETMRHRLEQHPDYAAKLLDNPNATLEEIRMLMRAQYHLVSQTASFIELQAVLRRVSQ